MTMKRKKMKMKMKKDISVSDRLIETLKGISKEAKGKNAQFLEGLPKVKEGQE